MHGTDAGRTTPDAPATSVEDTLLHELMRGFSAPGENAALSMGFVGSQTHKPHVPRHCVDTCLRHDANAVFSRGCPFLLSAARNRPDATFLQNGRCARGYRIHAEASSIGNDKVVLLTVAGDHVAPVGEMAETEVVTHLQRASQMVMRLGQVFEEHTGFADEILLNYEQLNAIFDLTRQIAHVPDVQQIKRILLDRVSLLLHCSPVWIATLDEAGLRPAEDMPRREAFPATLHNSRTAIEVVERVRAQREMAVADVEGFCLLAAPFACDAEQIDVVVAIREQHAEPFNSCDLQLVEAVLTFGAQIISNTLMHERIRRISIQVTRAMLRALDSKDHYTSDHSSRGGFLTLITAKEYGVSEEELRDFEWAGLLHDVGKIGIPEAILCKPGKLTKEEFDIIKQHPRVGVRDSATDRGVRDGSPGRPAPSRIPRRHRVSGRAEGGRYPPGCADHSRRGHV